MSVVRKIMYTILLFFWFMLMIALLTEYLDPARVVIYSGIFFWISIRIGSTFDTIENRGDDDEEEL